MNIPAARQYLAVERAEYRALCDAPTEVRECPYCGATEHRLDECETWVCMPCRLSRIVSMAEAIADTRGWAEWEGRRAADTWERAQ